MTEKKSRKQKIEVRKKLNALTKDDELFDGKKIFWALLARFVIDLKAQNKPMGGFNEQSWSLFQTHIAEQGKNIITEAVGGVSFGEKETQKFWNQKRTTAITKFQNALDSFVSEARQVNEHAESLPDEHRLYWEELTNWATFNQNKLGTNKPDINLANRSNEVEVFDSYALIQRFMFTTNPLQTISKRIGTGAYEMGRGDFPTADISDKYISGISEIRPLANEYEPDGLPIPINELQNRMMTVRDELKRTGGFTVNLFNAVLYMWWEKTKGAGENSGTAVITLAEICEHLGLPKRTDRIDTFKPASIKRVQEHLQTLARISINIRDGVIKGHKGKVQVSEQLITLSPVAKQDDLWQTGAWDSEWVAVSLGIGRFSRLAIGDANQFAPLPSVAGIDPRKRVEQMLGWFLGCYLRTNATRTSVVKLTVGMTLETVGLLKVVESKERLEKALDELVGLGDLIRCWEYEGESVDERIYRRQQITGKVARMGASDLLLWLDSKIVVEACQNLVEQYEKIGITAKEKRKEAIALPAPAKGLTLEVRQTINRHYEGNQSRASEDIGITASSLSRYLNGHQIRDNGKIKAWVEKMAMVAV
jgi:hypothetical protein